MGRAEGTGVGVTGVEVMEEEAEEEKGAVEREEKGGRAEWGWADQDRVERGWAERG